MAQGLTTKLTGIAHEGQTMTTEATPGNVPLSDQLGPDGKLHADGYFTWHRRDGYVLDAKLPAEFVLADKVARLAEQVENLRAALQWYADGMHFDKASPDAWDTVSGEPQNWWCDEAGTATVEDGSIAAMTLRGELTAAQIQALDEGDDQAWDRNAERLTREALGADVDRPINMQATSVDDL